jgi:tetratricopeptide (TPR) repeat protein
MTVELTPEKRQLLNAILAELDSPDADLGNVLTRHRVAQQPPAIREMLRRAALPRRFDEALYHDLLCDGFTSGDGGHDANTAPTFEDFLKLPEVQRLPRGGGYALRDDVRSFLRASWRRDDRDAWRQWHKRIADYLQEHRPDDTAGQLFHLVLAHVPEALGFFVERFDAADARFDLAKCFSLLAVLDEVQEDLGEGLAIARLVKQQRYGGRALFASDYYRANVYQERPGAREAANAIIEGTTAQWILHVFATGGMGKTAFLRWLIARQLVPAGVACARVDFDLVNTANVATYPWLLLIPFAEQLNVQLPRQYFTELLKELRTWESLLELPKSAARTMPVERLPTERLATQSNPILQAVALPDRATCDRFVRQFASILCEAQMRALLVIDTLESMTRADQMVPVYHLLRDLHALAPDLRCVLAGRYSIPLKIATAAAATPELDEFVHEFTANAVIHEIARFTDDEARQYLHARGVMDESIVDAIVRKVRQPARDGQAAGTNPFTLALVTELVLGLDAKGISRADIDALPSARFVYLVDRVIRRIPDQPLRWVVRYGALPRRLTPAYIEAVLLDPLKRALRGELLEDQLSVRPSASGFVIEPDIWKPDPDAKPTVDGLWRALSAYESPRGWIWRAPGAADAIQFHGDVVDPMRDLLWHQGIFRTLQRASIDYFERLAHDDPAHWADWTCEAIFHSFQLEGDDAAGFWLRQLRSPQANADPGVRRQIAREVLRREYAEDEQTPMRRDGGQPIISRGTLARAHVETARAILAVCGYVTTTDPDWQDLEQHVRIASQLALAAAMRASAAVTVPIVPEAVLASIEASRLIGAGKHVEAASILSEALARASESDERFSLEYQLADTLAVLRRPEASAHYREAIRLHRGRGRTNVRLADLQVKLASWYQSEGYHLIARDVLRAAFEASSEFEERYELRLQLAWSAIKAGDHDSAIELFSSKTPLSDSSKLPPEQLRLETWIALGFEDPRSAEYTASTALRNAVTPEDEARALDLLGRTYGELMRFADAADYWERAIPIFTRTMAPLAIESCFVDQIAMHTRVTGNFKEAASLIAQAERLPGARDAEISCRIDCERLFVLVHMDLPEAARETFARLMSPQTPPWPAALRARIMAVGFALDLLAPTDIALATFRETLDEIRPASARMEIADLLRTRATPLSSSPYWRQRFLSLFPVANPKKDSFVSRALRVAEMHRLFDSPDSARTLFNSVLDIAIGYYSPWVFVRTMEGLAMLDATPPDAPFSSASALASPSQVESPVAEAIAWLHRLRAMLAVTLADGEKAPSDEEWASCVAQVEKGLATEHTRTRWHAQLAEFKAARLRHTRAGGWGQLQAHVIGTLEAYRALGDLLAEQRIEREMPLLQSPAPPPAADDEDTRDLFVPPSAAQAAPPPRPAGPMPPRPPAASGVQPAPGTPAAAGAPPAPLTPVAAAMAQGASDTRGVKFDTGDIQPLFASKYRLMGVLQRNQMKLDVSTMAEELQKADAVAMLDEALTALSGIDPSQAEAPLALSRDALAALPWEWTRPSQFLWRTRKSTSPVMPEVTRWIQRALNRVGEALDIDGIYGPATIAAMTRFVKAEKLPVGFRPALSRLRKRAAPAEGDRTAPILIVAPHEFGHKADETTFAATGIAPAEVYRMFGGRTGLEVLREPSVSEFQDAMRRVNPAVVHLVCSLTEVSGLTHIGFSRRDRPSSELMAAPTLHRLLLSNSSIGPFLVLDVTRPSSTWEAASCLLRRNQFATDLFHLEGLPGILATGVAQPFYQSMRLEQCIAASLVPGKSMREVVTTIRSEVDRTNSAFNHLLAFTGAALFTAEPELPCLQT